ncbi:MAG: glycosyltransferase [Egibacteraceae bacterium]
MSRTSDLDLARLRGAGASPDASIVIPVNARADLGTVRSILGDIARYRGAHSFEVVLVVNNYEPRHPPAEAAAFEDAGARVVSVPDVWRPGEVVSFSARLPGIRAAVAEHVVLFDADCRVPDPTRLLDWYVERFALGFDAAYTHVDFYDLRDLASVRVKVFLHHLARRVKRVVFRVPTARGSNYAVRRSVLLDLYDRGLLADDLNVGPTVRSTGGRVAYSGSKKLAVLTSGRTFQGGWARILRYLRYRLRYNLAMLPVRHKDERPPYHATNRR